MAVTVTMPQLGETVTEGTILAWSKKPGDSISEDEVLLEISTDKVDTEVPSPAEGTILEILVPAGETVPVGTVLAVIGEAGEEVPAVAEAAAALAAAPEVPTQPLAPAPAVADPVAATPAAAAAPGVTSAPVGPLSPVVRKLAAEHSIDLAMVTGTGSGGRITRKDVMAFVAGGGAAAVATAPAPAPAIAAAPQPPAAQPTAAPPAEAPAAQPAPAAVPVTAANGQDEVIELDRLRLRIAENLINAKKTAAHVWTSVEVDYEAVERVRQAHKEQFKAAEGFSLTYLPFIARATIDALAAFPKVNSSFLLEQGQQILHHQVNLGIAVDLNQEGLIVTNIRGADGLRMKGIAREVVRLAGKVRAGQIEPDDVAGTSFTITNPGPFGSFMSAPIINVPNTGILSTDTVVKRPTVITNPDGSDAIGIHHIGYLGLTWDHRAFDGSTAVLFLARIKHNLETWDWEQELQ